MLLQFASTHFPGARAGCLEPECEWIWMTCMALDAAWTLVGMSSTRAK